MDQTRRAMRKLLNEQAPLPPEDDEEMMSQGTVEPRDLNPQPDPAPEKPVRVRGYPEAGTQAPSPVKKVIRDWSRLPPEVQMREPLLYYILGSGTDAYKMDPADAEYTDESASETQRCGNCEFSYMKVSNGKNLCSQIRNWIRPEGWCRLWRAPKSSV
ncbi:hypothetical protein LCGC14_0164660 [marine sediment metagenome]|uniref:High potential iron-sulfur proteins family profile domain-containing protein n=1 Tax=marine sediment metagenome TaxID=412755 RepID=A0A0F9VAQ3_9ZZZZ